MVYRLLFVFIILSSLFSCRSLTSSVMFETDNNFSYDSASAVNSSIIISPNDQLKILMTTNNGHILLEQTFSTGTSGNINNTSRREITYLVEKDSLVKIPTVGRVKLGGKTIREAESFLEEMFSEDYQNPFVKIEITNRKAILFLEESTQGHIIQLPEENMTLIEAIAASGGLSANSKSYQIKLIRNSSGNPMVYKYNFRNIENFKQADLTLAANDIIYVESKPRYVSKLLSEIQPYLVLLTSGVLVYSIFATK